MLDINLKETKSVELIQDKLLDTKVVGSYMDFENNAMFLIVDSYDKATGKVYKREQIRVSGNYYISKNQNLAPQLLTSITDGVKEIKATPTTIQAELDSGEVVIQDLPDLSFLEQIVIDTNPDLYKPNQII